MQYQEGAEVVTNRSLKYWSSKKKAAKKRKQYEVQRGLCAKCLMPWPIEQLKFHFMNPDLDDRTFDLRCDTCKENPPERVSFRSSDRWMYTGRRR